MVTTKVKLGIDNAGAYSISNSDVKSGVIKLTADI